MSCGCEFNTPKDVLERVRAKGVANDKMDVTYEIECECGNTVVMEKFETHCDNCDGIYTVTPCSQDNPEKIVFVK